jgi:hypothetical protein
MRMSSLSLTSYSQIGKAIDQNAADHLVNLISDHFLAIVFSRSTSLHRNFRNAMWLLWQEHLVVTRCRGLMVGDTVPLMETHL